MSVDQSIFTIELTSQQTMPQIRFYLTTLAKTDIKVDGGKEIYTAFTQPNEYRTVPVMGVPLVFAYTQFDEKTPLIDLAQADFPEIHFIQLYTKTGERKAVIFAKLRGIERVQE